MTKRLKGGKLHLVQGVGGVWNDAHRSDHDGDEDDDGEISVARVADNERGGEDGMGGAGAADLDRRFRESF